MSTKLQPVKTVEPQPGDAPRPQRQRNEQRVAQTRARICLAVIECLDAVGYCDTSINLVQGRAGVSRGALTYHFPTKEDMIVAVVDRLLDPDPDAGDAGLHPHIARIAGRRDGPADFAHLWAKVVNTREGRALFEILVATRTDKALKNRVRPQLERYNSEINRSIGALFSADHAAIDELATLWTMCRALMHGLHVQNLFDRDPQVANRVVQRFSELIAPLMTLR